MKPMLFVFAFAGLVLVASGQSLQPGRLLPRETTGGGLFRCYAPEAGRVYLAGSFNQWAGNVGGRIADTRFAMSGPDEHGVFHKTVPLPVGVHAYKFAIENPDRTMTWISPDFAPRRDEEGNALIVVDGVLDDEESLVYPQPPWRGPDGSTTFELFAPDAEIVFLAGDFNNWANRKAGQVHDLRFAMRGPDAHGIWRISAALAPGRYRYQFVLNGSTWIQNPLVTTVTPDGHSILEAP